MRVALSFMPKNAPHTLPEIVLTILSQLARRRAAAQLGEDEFQSKLDRLRAEELERRGMTLLVRYLSGGRTRFIIKDDATRSVIDMMDCA